MVDFFDRIYTNIVDKNKFLIKIRFYSFLRLTVRVVVNIILPIYYIITKNSLNAKLSTCLENDNRLIVSLTTFPKRINRVWIVIESILRQTHKPDKIILWISNEQFQSIDILPIKLLKQRNRGLEIRLVEGDIRSHKKYYYTLQEFPNDYMLTADDDIFYRSTMIEDMFNYSNQFPLSVISQYSSEMQWSGDQLEPYIYWKSIQKFSNPNLNSFFGSGGGTLFPPHSFDSDVLNSNLFMSLTPTADDIWLNAMCKLKRTKITVTNYYTSGLPVINVTNTTLESINNRLNKNDEQILAVSEYYKKNRGIDPFEKLID